MPDIPLGDRPEKFGRLYLSLQFGDPLEEFGELLEGEYTHYGNYGGNL